MTKSSEVSARLEQLRGDRMRTPDEVAAMLRLRALGWGERRIATALGCNRRTVRRYLAAEGWVGYRRPRRPKLLEGLEDWLAERFRRHRGNADVVRQDLRRERGLAVSLRTIERAVAALRQALRAEARATVRFETPPGNQLQIDFGETGVTIDGDSVRVYLFVATLGYSRRGFVRPFRHERQSAWFDGIEAAFQHFGGVAHEVLLDNARALVDHHDAATREVSFNERLRGVRAITGASVRGPAPRTGRARRGRTSAASATSSTMRSPAMPLRAGRRWRRILAGGCGRSPTGISTARPAKKPIVRFTRAEAEVLRPIDGRPPFRQLRELVRRVQADGTIEMDTNTYSVPWRLIGETVQVVVAGGRISIRHRGIELAAHAETTGRRQRVAVAAHLAGIGQRQPERPAGNEPELLRPLAEYERAAGGGW